MCCLRVKLNHFILIHDFQIAGLDTNIEFIKDLCSHPNFQQGQVYTGFIKEHFRELFPKLCVPKTVTLQAVLASILHEDLFSLQHSLTTNDPFSPFATEIGLRLNHTLTRTYRFNVSDGDIDIEVKYIEPEVYSMRLNKIGPWMKVIGTLKRKKNSLELCTEIDGKITRASVKKIHNKLYLFTKVSIQFSLIRTLLY